jgi:hypothetical protein
MKIIFLKELRENAKWALLIFGAFNLLILFAIRTGNPFIVNHLAQERTLLLAPLAGLLMGIAQSFYEVRPDNWAFVVHRPVSRIGTFAGKCLAGLALLYLSLVIPCLLVAAWAARPGNVATPFHWRSVLPMLADITNSGCFYFAGMVLTLRKARWFGSRIVPLGWAVACSVAVLSEPEFWQAMLLSVLGIFVSAIAAWNVFATGGSADRGWFPRWALGMMIFSGALAICLVLEDFIGVFNTDAAWAGVRLDRDGNVLRVYWTLNANERRCVIADPDGTPLKKYQGVDVDDPANAGQFVQFSNLVFDDRFVPWPYSMQSRGYRSRLPEVIRLRAVARPKTDGDVNIGSSGGRDIAMPVATGAARVPYICVLDAADQIIKLFDPITHVLLGTVGPAGFSSAADGTSQRFPSQPLSLFFQENTHTLTLSSIVYWMELDEKRVRQLFTAAPNEPILSACELPPQTNPTVVVLTSNQLHLLKPSGEILCSIPFDLDRSKYFLQFAIIPANHHFAVLAEPLPSFETTNTPQVFEYAIDGTLVRQTQLRHIAADASARKWQRTATMGAILPPALLPLYLACNLDWVFETDCRQCWQSLARSMLISSVLCGVVSFFLGRRLGFGFGKTAIWAALNLLLGPAGVVTMLSLYEWPARELCATCGRQRFVGRRECVHCGGVLSPPALDGRELFEPEDAFQPVG